MLPTPFALRLGHALHFLLDVTAYRPKQRWLRATLPALGAEAEELAYRLAEEAGAQGAEIRDAEVVAYFSGDADPEAVAGAVAEVAGAAPALDWLEAEPWAERWRDHFTPQRVGRLWIGAPWHEPPEREEGAIPVILNPGAAFGTGTHETTRLCLEALADLLGGAPGAFNPWIVRPGGGGARLAGAAAPSVLDVGTGSGVLALAAAKLGAGRVVGVEIEETALRSAAENVALNDVPVCLELRLGGPERAGGAFDLVLANLILGALLDLKDALLARTRPGGTLVLSGLLAEQADEVERAYGLPTLERRRKGDWIALVMKKP